MNWQVRDKQKFLAAVMRKLAGNAHISFEGHLRQYKLLRVNGASENETAILQRNTIAPLLDFVILPLEHPTIHSIMAAMNNVVSHQIIHVQIERDGILEFGAYDNFHPEFFFFGKACDKQFLDTLVADSILRIKK